MDVVLGYRWDPPRSGWCFVEGENADGATVDDDNFRITAPDPQGPTTSSAPGQVLSAIPGTREGRRGWLPADVDRGGLDGSRRGRRAA